MKTAPILRPDTQTRTMVEMMTTYGIVKLQAALLIGVLTLLGVKQSPAEGQVTLRSLRTTSGSSRSRSTNSRPDRQFE